MELQLNGDHFTYGQYVHLEIFWPLTNCPKLIREVFKGTKPSIQLRLVGQRAVKLQFGTFLPPGKRIRQWEWFWFARISMLFLELDVVLDRETSIMMALPWDHWQRRQAWYWLHLLLFFFLHLFLPPALLSSLISLLWPWTFGNRQRYPLQPKPFLASLNRAHGLRD